MPTVAIFDAECGLCRRAARLLRTLDVAHRVDLLASDDRAALTSRGLASLDSVALARDFHVIETNPAGGRRTALGYAGYLVLARRIILLWPLLPVLWLGKVSGLGPRLYRHIADRRTCAVNPARR
ncbi:hypothetical protein BH11PLA1_BH11PLA1_23990 [soil metagenome]